MVDGVRALTVKSVRSSLLLLLLACSVHSIPSPNLPLSKSNPSLAQAAPKPEPALRAPSDMKSDSSVASSELRHRGKAESNAAVAENKPKSLQSQAPAAPRKFIDPNLVSLALFIATAACFYYVKSSVKVAAPVTDENKNYALGLAIAGVALVGNAAVGALRKILSQHNIGSAQQVGLATLIQGIASIVYCIHSGQLDVGPKFVSHLPKSDFWIAAVGSSALGSVVKTLETKAFAESDISLCAPFLAFDPVMQFIVGVAVTPVACSLAGVGCDEAQSSYPPYHVLSVACIAYGAFLLGFSAKSAAPGTKAVHYLGPLPLGSWFILLNCVIYGFTSRMDKVAIKSAGKTLYYAYGRILMASTTLGGSFMSGGMTMKELKKFMAPKVLLLLLSVCVADAVYMLSLYQAFAWISPVYVTAIKRGGGILLSSLLGVLLFNESMKGRFSPILLIVAGVTFLCL